jgi:hypothetical protein
MALKFRRGTAAQKSGSLAFGEPYVNTTLGTLQVGLDTGDVTLTSVGSTTQFEILSVSASSFISASTIYATSGLTGSIAATNGVVSGSSQVSYTGLSNIPSGIISSSTQIDTLFNIDGLISASSQVSFTGITDKPTLVSGSSQVSYIDLSNIPVEIISSSTQIATLGFATTGSNTFYGTQTITGALEIYSASNSEVRLHNGATGIQYHIINGDFGNFQIHNATTNRALIRFQSASLEDGSSDVYLFNGLHVSKSIQASSFTGSIAATNGIVSGSSQVIDILTSLNTFSASNGNTSLNSYTGSLNDAIQLTGSTVSFLGNIVVYGTQSIINSTNLAINDNLIYLNEGSTITNPDLGIVGNYNDGTYAHGGIFRDASDSGVWKVFEGYTPEPSGTIDTSHGTFALADFKADVITATSFNGVINATNGIVSGSTQIKNLLPAGTISGSSQVTGIGNAQLTNSTISGIALGSNLGTLTIGTGLSGTSYNGSTGVTIANTGVTSLSAGTGVTLGATTGACSIAIGQSVATSASPTFAGLTINGAITATGDITAFFTSDKRHKNNIQLIPNALEKVCKLNGVTWEWNEDVNEVTKTTPKTGLIAQEVQEVLPQVVTERVDGFLALDYSKMMGLMVEAIKEQQTQIHDLTLQIEELKKQKGL